MGEYHRERLFLLDLPHLLVSIRCGVIVVVVL